MLFYSNSDFNFNSKTAQRLWKMMIVLCFSVIILTGCGGAKQETEADGQTDQNRNNCLIQDYELPDADEAMQPLMKAGDWTRQLDIRLGGNSVYRLTQLWGKWQEPEGFIAPEGTESNWEALKETDITLGYYLQVLSPPYQEWINYDISSLYWEENAEEHYLPMQLYPTDSGKVYCSGDFIEDADSSGADFVGLWNADTSGEVLGKTAEYSITKETFWVTEGGFYLYEPSAGTLTRLDERLESQQEWKITEQLYGILPSQESDDVYLYGRSNEDVVIRNLQDGIDGIDGIEVIDVVTDIDAYDYQAALSENGNFYLADLQSLWKIRAEEGAEQLCDLIKRDYLLERIYDMYVTAEEEVLLLTEFEEAYHILEVTESEEPLPEKQIIVMAIGECPLELENAIYEFNRQSSLYRIELMLPKEAETGLEFADRVQLEIAAGRSPDVLATDVITPADAVQNGYLQKVEGMLENEAEYWQAALDTGRVDGVLYGIPYECRLEFAVYSQELVGERSSLTLSELMQLVKDSDVEILQADFDGMDIVEYYGLFDNSNTAFIDWEKGESHLTQEPFLELLEFARQYADTRGNLLEGKDYADEERGKLLQSGKIAAEIPFPYMDSLDMLNYLEACFAGKPACIGFPREEGNGIYVTAQCLYLSSTTEVKDGFQEFVRFLLSKEQQERYIRPGKSITALGSDPTITIRNSAIEYLIQWKKSEKLSDGQRTWLGTTYSAAGFTDEQEQRFRFIMENARPRDWYTMDIRDIIREELEPYFAGQKTATEVAEILDKRVQLYLDER